jgi:glycosyltransferase involved in cell wall biosynthesis
MTSDLPIVSIVAICYNQARFVVETLESIRNQAYPIIQLIIVDDCSTDNSVEVIQNWIDGHKMDCVFVKHDENLGVSKTCNDGLSLVEGKYYQIIACDDLLLKEKIYEQVNILEEDDELAAVFGNSILIDANGIKTGNFFKDYIKHKPKYEKETIKFPKTLDKNFLHPVSGLIRTVVARKIVQYDETLFAEDSP